MFSEIEQGEHMLCGLMSNCSSAIRDTTSWEETCCRCFRNISTHSLPTIA